jgi:hypothetical protein
VPFNNASYFPLETPKDAASTPTWLNCDPAGHGGHALPPSQPVPKCVNQSYASLRASWQQLQAEVGLQTLVYGTLEEFGIGVVQPSESIERLCSQGANRTASGDDKYAAALACGANRLMRDRFPTAPLVDPTKDSSIDGGWQRGSWDSVIMDFGDDEYAEFQVENARRVADQFAGAVAGVCLDRGDFIGQGAL